MKIKGELFYDMVTHEVVEFSPRDVNLVFVQDCEIQVVDAMNMQIVETSYLYVVTVVMENGNFYAAKPFDSEEYAQMIAETLAQYCEYVAHGN